MSGTIPQTCLLTASDTFHLIVSTFYSVQLGVIKPVLGFSQVNLYSECIRAPIKTLFLEKKKKYNLEETFNNMTKYILHSTLSVGKGWKDMS